MTATEKRPSVTGANEPASGGHLVPGIVRALRPKQWLKNVLVFAAPVAAGVIRDGDVLGKTLAAFGAFCLISSGTYLLNDAMDVESDRLHPTKRHRPIASGVVPMSVAYPLAVVLIGGALALGFVTEPQPRHHVARVPRAHAVVLDPAQAGADSRHHRGGRRIRVASRRGWRGDRRSDLRVVLHRGVLRRVVHGVGQT